MLSVNKILVPVDFSHHAQKALKTALDLAERTGASIDSLHVEVLHVGPGTEEVFRQLKDFVESVVASRGSDQVVPIKYVTDRDVTPAPAILRYADEEDVDLIILGTHGRRGIKKFFLGSVAREVVQLARQPVLTVNEEGMREVKNILVPIDFSESSREALRYAKEFSSFYNASIDMLHVIEDTLHPAFYGPRIQSIYDVEPDIEEKALKHLKALYEETPGHVGPVSYKVVPGHAATEILNYATEEGHDLILMATHGLTGLAHFVMGSVAERVVQRAKCPVFVVKTFAKSLVRYPVMTPAEVSK